MEPGFFRVLGCIFDLSFGLMVWGKNMHGRDLLYGFGIGFGLDGWLFRDHGMRG